MFKISIIVGPRYNVFEALTFFLLTSYNLFDCVNGQEEFLVEFIFNQPSINSISWMFPLCPIQFLKPTHGMLSCLLSEHIVIQLKSWGTMAVSKNWFFAKVVLGFSSDWWARWRVSLALHCLLFVGYLGVMLKDDCSGGYNSIRSHPTSITVPTYVQCYCVPMHFQTIQILIWQVPRPFYKLWIYCRH